MNFNELKLEKEITKAKLAQLEKKGIFKVDDMIRLYPRSYSDYTKAVKTEDAEDGKTYAFKLTLTGYSTRYGRKGAYMIAECAEDDQCISVFFFNVKADKKGQIGYMERKLSALINKEVFCVGKFQNNEFGKSIANPEYFEEWSEDKLRIYPKYPKIPGMGNEYFSWVLNACLDQYEAEDSIPECVRERFSLIDEDTLLSYIHKPKSKEEVTSATTRLIFEKLYPLAYRLVDDAKSVTTKSKVRITELNSIKRFMEDLPYDLTADQKKIVDNFIEKTQAGSRVNALIQGDVGSGKTVCAFSMMMAVCGSGYQSVLMAPTGILARQHYEELKGYADKYGYKTALLSTEIKAKERKEILKQIENGEVDFIVGTHSVISKDVVFKNLGLAIVDEEHKFGVKQREALKEKAQKGVHTISMSATPIPRSLAMTIYGNGTEVYTIGTMPSGRKPVKTALMGSIEKILGCMEEEIKKGHQCYIVCPLIGYDVEEPDDEKKIYSVEEIGKIAEGYFSPKGIRVATVTGKMKGEEKDAVINSFVANEAQILIATTIIEVGVNVPNATEITIMNADRFGLASLHQLRGRVGRNSLQSYCILHTDDIHNERLQVMYNTTNGFTIAEEDLRLRAPGDLVGTRQSGKEENLTLMLKHPKYFNQIKEYIKENYDILPAQFVKEEEK